MLEGMAKFSFEEEIQAGKLTTKQATAYVQCTQKDYSESYSKSPEAQKHKETMQQYKEYLDPLTPKKMSAQKKADFMADFEKARLVFEPLQKQSEERCMKKLGLKVPRGKVWGRAS
jgi:catalase